MPEHAEFRDFYLNEIGVHTPSAVDSTRSSDQSVHLIKPEGESATSVLSSGCPTSTTNVSDSSPEAKEILKELATQAASCTVCQLSEKRNRVVFGVGNPKADIVFIGEAPGGDEDLKGEPFVGQEGQLLDRMLLSLGLDRSQVYMMNIVKCRPANNRDPKREEVEACSRWFDAQLRALSPKVICLLGRAAAQRLLKTDASLSAMRGRWHEYHGIAVQVIYHPGYLLRSPQQKRDAWRDLCLLKQRCQ